MTTPHSTHCVSTALRQLVVSGARPAIAFEQFDREHQTDVERARREQPGDVDYMIAQAKGKPRLGLGVLPAFHKTSVRI